MNRQRNMISFKPSILDLRRIDEIRTSIIDERGIILNLSETMRYALQETARMLRERRASSGEQLDHAAS